jgi:RNA polymerase sigma-70 factor, ECF subfamily
MMQVAVWAIRLPLPAFRRAVTDGLGTLSDETLMGRYRDGDPAAFEELYRRHRARLHRFVARMIPREADEVFQEVWLAVVKGRSRYVPEARFVTWLFTIAHHRAATRWRTAGRSAEVSGEDSNDLVPDQGADPLTALANQELGQALQIAIAQLPPPQREAFLMQAEGELNLSEIAEATGTSRETVKSRLRYANQRLRCALESWK